MPEAKKPANLAKRLAKPKPDSDKKLREMNRSLLEREKILEQHNAKLEAERDVDLTSEEPPSPAKPVEPSVVYTPKPETVTAENAFSTFSLNVSDVVQDRLPQSAVEQAVAAQRRAQRGVSQRAGVSRPDATGRRAGGLQLGTGANIAVHA